MFGNTNIRIIEVTLKRSCISKILPYVHAGEVIPHDELLDTLNEITGTDFDSQRREVASSILPDAGRYLPSEYLLSFIGAQLSDERLKQLIAERRSYLKRLANLLPAIFDLLNIKDEIQIESALMQIDVCCKYYHNVKDSSYFSKQHKTVVNDIKSVIKLAGDLKQLLSRLDYNISTEFEQHDAAYMEYTGRNHTTVYFSDLLRLLDGLQFSAELTLFKDSIGSQAFHLSGNRARTHIVEDAYQMALQFKAPDFKTTPGSDFSALCSLIYELATGEADESLAGAINRFGRSTERQKIDEQEVIHRYQNSEEGRAAYEADNFAAVKETVASYQTEVDFWRCMLSAREWEDAQKSQIAIRLAHSIKCRDSAANMYGPFLVWAHQVSTKEQQPLWDLLEGYEQLSTEFYEILGRKARDEEN